MAKDTSKVGAGTSKVGPISTTFKDSVCKKPDEGGTWASVKNGIDVAGGAKGASGEMSEVTLVEVGGSPAAGAKISARGRIANRT